MTDKEKLQAILALLTDQNVANLEKDGQLEGDQERFGAVVFATYAFNEARKIINK